MENQDNFYIERAIALAETAVAQGLAPFGAVIVNREGVIVAEGYNTVAADFDPSAHGEVVAIRRACASLKSVKLDGCTLYTSCEPCLMCTYLIVRTGINRVVYAARGSDVPNRPPLLDLSLPDVARWLNDRSEWPPLEVVGDVLRERSAKLLEGLS